MYTSDNVLASNQNKLLPNSVQIFVQDLGIRTFNMLYICVNHVHLHLNALITSVILISNF